MKIVMFYHSLISDWNHGNAHFLRGIASELIKRNHQVDIFEPEDSWSLQNLLSEYGEKAIKEFNHYYPNLKSNRYNLSKINLNDILKNADLVIVHEWNEPELVNKIGNHRKNNRNYFLLFHDTHHRTVTDKDAMKEYNLENFDGVLAYGNVIREIYLTNKLVKQAWTWHEAADTNIFHPMERKNFEGDVVWIGNWGDEERSDELYEFLIEPVRRLNLNCKIYGVGYPQTALDALKKAGIAYGGWLPNYKVPQVFSRYRLTVHIPRRPYIEALPGIPTIRPFEALACGIPLISSLWDDKENLFSPGDILFVKDGIEMEDAMKKVLYDKELSGRLSSNGLNTILKRHTCSHRTDELLGIYNEIKLKNKKIMSM